MNRRKNVRWSFISKALPVRSAVVVELMVIAICWKMNIEIEQEIKRRLEFMSLMDK